MLTDIFGDSPQVKVLDFLLDNRNYDHSLSDIARGANVARPTLYKILNNLLELNIVKETRNVGNAKLYALNIESEIVKKITLFDFELSKKMVRSEIARAEIDEIETAEALEISLWDRIIEYLRAGRYKQAIKSLPKPEPI